LIADCRLPIADSNQLAIGNWQLAISMNRGLNRFAIFVACATFFLIIAGALVTSNDAGLATPDWPLSNGQVFPKMVGNLFWEHGHRMVATTVGMLTIVLMIYILAKEKRSWVRSSASLLC
jgi:cytochrome c oxidase assembly protein subunit 15